MNRRYTKADLEEIVSTQYENFNAMHDLLSIMKHHILFKFIRTHNFIHPIKSFV